MKNLRDKRAVVKIDRRLIRLAEGNQGDVRSIGDGLSELRIDYGPGYRVYYLQRGAIVIVLLCGGDKSSQDRDIAKAKYLAKQWRDAL
jgi:putative addiction module killer protein